MNILAISLNRSEGMHFYKNIIINKNKILFLCNLLSIFYNNFS